MPLSYNNLLDTAFSLYKKAPPGTPLNLAGSFYDLYKSAPKPTAQPATPQTAKIGNGMIAGFESGANSTVTPPKPTPSYSPSYNVSSSNSYNEKNPVVLTQNKVTPNQVANSTPTPPPTTQNTPNTPNSNDTSSDVLNIDALKKLYGFSEAPTYQKPDTSMYDAEINSYNPQNELKQIQANLDNQLNEITKKYQLERESEAKKTENERLGQLSNLYNIGYVNPASSGVSSVGMASNEILNKRIDTLKSMEQAERNDAMSRAYGFKTSAQNTALQLAKEQKASIEKQATDSYANDRQKWTDSVSQINNIVNLYKSGRQIQKEDKDQAQQNITMLLTNFGSQAFEGVDQNEISNMEKAAGLPSGTLVRGLKTLKEKELANKNGVNGLNLKEINGSLYNVKTDAYGNVVPELIIKGAGKVNDNLVKINGTDYIQNADGTYSLPNTPQQSSQASELKTNALTTAQSLLQKFTEGKGTSAVGKSGTLNSFGYGFIPGTDRANFVNDFNSLKSLLSLDNVKLLKGQGAVSDSERALLEKASTKLSLSQSEDEFKSTLNDLIKGLNNQNNQTGQQSMSLEALAQQNGYDPSEIQTLRKLGKSEEAIRSLLQGSSFNTPLNMGQNGSIASQVAQKYPTGTKGGQCTTFLHSLVKFPAIGDGKLQKFASVDKFGISADQLRQNPRIGDVIVTGESRTYGHTAMINAILPNGFRVTESNFRGDERVTHDRIIPFNSPQIYGAIRGPLKV